MTMDCTRRSERSWGRAPCHGDLCTSGWLVRYQSFRFLFVPFKLLKDVYMQLLDTTSSEATDQRLPRPDQEVS
jgi:hypothetical protein